MQAQIGARTGGSDSATLRHRFRLTLGELMKNVDPHLQQVLPIVYRADVFGGMFHETHALNAEEAWDKDCAAQCIVNIMEIEYGGVDYQTVADRLHSKKRWEDAGKRWTFTRKLEWMMDHTGATTLAIYETLSELTMSDWDYLVINSDIPLSEFAWDNRHIDVMAVGTPKHITAVADGIIHDSWNSSKKPVQSILFPCLYFKTIDFIY